MGAVDESRKGNPPLRNRHNSPRRSLNFEYLDFNMGFRSLYTHQISDIIPISLRLIERYYMVCWQ